MLVFDKFQIIFEVSLKNLIINQFLNVFQDDTIAIKKLYKCPTKHEHKIGENPVDWDESEEKIDNDISKEYDSSGKDANCIDIHPWCIHWAAAGNCIRNHYVMNIKCKKSCNSCE